MAAIEPPVSPIRTNRPELRVDAAAINDEPAELDGTPTTPHKSRTKSIAAGILHDDAPLSEKDKQELAELIKQRKSNPAVLVDLPQTPQAEELAISGASSEAK